MGELKKIALKGMLLLGMLAGLNLVYNQFFFRKELAETSEAGRLLYAVADTAEILYFGESSDFSVADQDLSKKSISGFLAEYFPGRKVAAVDRAATHAGNYYDMLRDLPGSAPVQTVVVTVNMRSFNADWVYSKLETALNKEMVLLKPGPRLWRRFLLSLRDYDARPEALREQDVQAAWRADTLHFPYPFPFPNVARWDSAVANGHDRRPPGLANLTPEERQLACHYVKTFAFQIDNVGHPRLHDLDRIVALANDRGWHLVLNLLPDNLEQATHLVGEDLAFLMRQNRDLLVRRYGNLQGVTFLDQFESVADANFRDRDWTNEHYLEEGRRAIADRIAKAIAAFYPGEMQIPKVEFRPQTVFLNDCEGTNLWSQMQTLDATQAHSGSKASFTMDGKEKFGITFSYPIAKMDTTAFDSMDFSCWVYQEAVDHIAAIAWEIGGEKTGNLWECRQLKSQLHTANQWEYFHMCVPLWPNMADAEVIKVYPFNPAKIQIWFDDIRIAFVGRRAK